MTLFRLTAPWAIAASLWWAGNAWSAVQGSASEQRARLAQAVLLEDHAAQLELIRTLAASSDPLVEQVLMAWREGTVFIHEFSGQKRVPFLLDAATDADGKAKGIQLLDGEVLKGADGQPLFFLPSDLTPVDTDAKLRRAIKATLDLRSLSHPNPSLRLDAATKLGLEQNADYLSWLEAQLAVERIAGVRKALQQAIAITQLADEKPAVRLAAIKKLGEWRSLGTLSLLKRIVAEAQAHPESVDPDCARAARKAVGQIEDHLSRTNLVGTAFRGLSLSSVLLVASLGLAITFGLMGVINMAHGEMIMVGAYAAYVTQNAFAKWFGASGRGFDCYFPIALLAAFATAALVGLILERAIIRFLYHRPLESLLATWGVSLVLQQIFRSVFGAANVQVNSPSWLSGSLDFHDVLLAYNRLFVIGFALFIVLLVYALLTKTSAGLQVRAVMQNRNMAACLGVRTSRVNMMTFAFGSGLAGVAGACLSQIGNVGPGLGQAHIVDCFMVVVLGGVGNLVGTISAALGIGVTDQILQPFLGAVLGKITVLSAIILFLQWRPAGLFVTRSRSLEG